MAEQQMLPGLALDSNFQRPNFDPNTPPLKRLAEKEFHDKLRDYFLVRLNASESRMKNLYPRWRVNEHRTQAFVNLPDYEKILESMNKDQKPPSPVSITFPYAFANAWTAATYHLHTFCGRKPMFQIGARKANSIVPAQNMEQLLQWNADATRLIRTLWNFFMDGQIYGVGVMRTLWKVKRGMRTQLVTNPDPMQLLMSKVMGRSGRVRQKVMKLLFEGNEVEPVDPFMFFPDPNVPMSEVNRKGEYVFWRTFIGKHELLAAQADGKVAYIDKCHPLSAKDAGESRRSEWLGGDSHAAWGTGATQIPYYQFDQGSVIIIPKELGLGDSSRPERWLVGIVGKRQIVQLEPLDVEHDMHPVAVAEPTSMGYGFGQPSMVDFVGPTQDIMSWLLNSHIHNIRAALNNSFIFDPSMIEMQDLKNPEPGKLIRLKRAAMGQDVRTAIQQIPVSDVTRSHISDFAAFQRVADTISGINDNVRGLQDAGGRKTATEVRTSAEAGASRQAAQARIISAQAIVDLTEQMSVNLQSKLSEEVLVSILGPAGIAQPLTIGAGDIMGDFDYPVHDGTLPLDKVAMFDLWRELLMGIGQDQELRSQYSMPKIFEFVAKLGGAQNIEQFKVDVAPEPPQDGIGVGRPM